MVVTLTEEDLETLLLLLMLYEEEVVVEGRWPKIFILSKFIDYQIREALKIISNKTRILRIELNRLLESFLVFRI